MVKFIVGMLVLAAIVVGVMYYAGGVEKFDPSKEGREKRKLIKVGMTWKQALDAMKTDPKKYQTYLKQGDNIKEGAEVKFDRKSLEHELKTGVHKYGFRMLFRFSEDVAFAIICDDRGVVISIVDEQTMADLLDTRKP